MKIGGRGWILLQCKDGGKKMLYNVLYVTKLKTNILSLNQFDEQGYQILMEGGFLTIYDQYDRLLVNVNKTLRKLYLLKLNLILSCMVVDGNSKLTWTWHRRFGDLNHEEIIFSRDCSGFPKLEISENVCCYCITTK